VPAGRVHQHRCVPRRLGRTYYVGTAGWCARRVYAEDPAGALAASRVPGRYSFRKHPPGLVVYAADRRTQLLCEVPELVARV
jgi:hypothetical protein